MTYKEILKILNKYDINTINELEYSLSVFDSNNECNDDPEDDTKNCINANCYEDFFVPDCRKIIEVYKKYFQKDISKKKDFINYLTEHTNKSKSSIDNYISCKSCNQQISKGSKTSIKISDSEFKKDFCKNLNLKFDYKSLFETDYTSIKQFLIKEHHITDETFIPIYQSEDKMTKNEAKKLFELTHTNKEQLKSNLLKSDNLQGSDQYKLNLALYAFDRGLINESWEIIDSIVQINNNIDKDIKHLKAKILSSQQKDKESIEILEELKQSSQDIIEIETQNLLAASVKRYAFGQYNLYGDDNLLIKDLTKSMDIYFSVYKLSNDYYPALNYIYLRFMIGFVENKDNNYFVKFQDEATTIWQNLDLKINDWWSFISNIEYLVIIKDYDEAKEQLNSHFQELDKNEITEFNISSTLRQLELYSNFCDDSKLVDFISFLKEIVSI